MVTIRDNSIKLSTVSRNRVTSDQPRVDSFALPDNVENKAKPLPTSNLKSFFTDDKLNLKVQQNTFSALNTSGSSIRVNSYVLNNLNKTDIPNQLINTPPVSRTAYNNILKRSGEPNASEITPDRLFNAIEDVLIKDGGLPRSSETRDNHDHVLTQSDINLLRTKLGLDLSKMIGYGTSAAAYMVTKLNNSSIGIGGVTQPKFNLNDVITNTRGVAQGNRFRVMSPQSFEAISAATGNPSEITSSILQQAFNAVKPAGATRMNPMWASNIRKAYGLDIESSRYNQPINVVADGIVSTNNTVYRDYSGLTLSEMQRNKSALQNAGLVG